MVTVGLLLRLPLAGRSEEPTETRQKEIAAVEKQIANLNKSPFTSSVEKFDARPIPDKWKLYPIPLHACELNPSLTQNPGWEDGICK